MLLQFSVAILFTSLQKTVMMATLHQTMAVLLLALLKMDGGVLELPLYVLQYVEMENLQVEKSVMMEIFKRMMDAVLRVK